MKWPWTKAVAERRRKHNFSSRGFAAADVDRMLSPWKWDGGFTSSEITGTLRTIRSRSRDMAKNSPHFRRWLKLIETNVVGEGFALKSTPHDGQPGAKDYRLDTAAAKIIEAHFWRWCSTPAWCDLGGRKTVAQIDRLCAKTWARDGEYFVMIQSAQNPYGISLRVIRPDACDERYNSDNLGNGNIVRCGVELEPATLRPVAYYMRTTPENAYVTTAHGYLTRIPADRIIHGYTQEDEEQTRGVPWGHASLTKLKMLDEYDRAELVAARDEACSVRSYYAPQGAEDEVADLTKDENSDIAQALTMEKEPGQSEILPMGWKQEIHTPQHPNRELTAFKTSMLKDVASGLGVEYSNFANDWAGVSFSSVRVGTISERDMWIVLQSEMMAHLKTPIFTAWLKSFLALEASGSMPAAKYDKFIEHEFRGRRWMWVDPMKDMNAAKMAVENHWKTNTDVAADLGNDYTDNLETVAREGAARELAGVEDAPMRPGQQPAAVVVDTTED
jgi:lambda family phage portal protein